MKADELLGKRVHLPSIYATSGPPHRLHTTQKATHITAKSSLKMGDQEKEKGDCHKMIIKEKDWTA